MFSLSVDGQHGLVASKDKGWSTWKNIKDLLINNSEFDGFTDWRLPSSKEFNLLSIKKFAEFYNGEGSSCGFWATDATGSNDSLMMYMLSHRDGTPSKKVIVPKIYRGKDFDCNVILVRSF